MILAVGANGRLRRRRGAARAREGCAGHGARPRFEHRSGSGGAAVPRSSGQPTPPPGSGSASRRNVRCCSCSWSCCRSSLLRAPSHAQSQRRGSSGCPGGSDVLTTMKDVHGASMVTITVAFLAALCGAFIMRSAQSADRRLVVAGFRPIQAVLPRLAGSHRDVRVARSVVGGHGAELHARLVAGLHRRQPACRPHVRVHRRPRRLRARPTRGDVPRAVPGHARYRHPAEPDVRRRHARRARLRLSRLRRREGHHRRSVLRRLSTLGASSRSRSAGSPSSG
jgi:hypothetical protein